MREFQMYRRVVGIAVIALVAATLIGAILPARAQAALAERSRIAGANRYDTAAQVAVRAFPAGAPVVYLARADVPADALAAGALTDGPVLLVPSCGTLPAAVKQALGTLSPERVIALGGEGAVCSKLLSATGLPSTRLSGTDRYATAAKVAQRAFAKGAPVVYLARGDVAADALAAGALTDGPLLLVPSTGSVPASVAQAITALGAKQVIALGGQAAVSSAILERAAAGRETSRISGSDRYATAVLVAQRAFPNGAPVVYLARGDVAADALAAGALTDGPVILTPSCRGLPGAAAGLLSTFGTQRVVALGGQSAVCDATLADAAGATQRSGDDWLAAVNVYRRAGGLTPISAQPGWNLDVAAVARYMVEAGTMTHFPDAKSAHYNAAAARGGRNSNLMVSTLAEQSQRRAIEELMRSPGAAAWITHPRLKYGSYGSYANSSAPVWRWGAALDVIRGNDHRPVDAPVLWPADGGRVPLTNGVDKLEGCSGSGLIAHLRLDPDSTLKGVRWVDGAGASVAHCVSKQLTGEGARTDIVWIQANSPLGEGGRYTIDAELGDGRHVTATFDVVSPENVAGYPVR